MSDLLLDFVSYLVAQGAVQGDGVDIFRDNTPDSPDSLVTLFEYQGEPAPLNEAIAHRSVQIVARASSATAAKLKARELYALVSPLNRYLKLTAERWCQLYPRQTPFKIKTDSSGRIYYGFNLGVTTYND